MADFHYLPLFTDSYLADTRHLTTEEHGAYLLLMMEAWRRERCALPDDDALLARLTGLNSSRWQDVKPTVMAFWTLDKRRREWTQKRLDKERAFVARKSDKNRDAALTRWNKKKKRDANAMPKRCQNDAPTPTPTPIDKKEEDNPPISPLSDFDIWWRQYPIKEDKKRARRCYATACKITTPEILLAKAAEYIDFCRRTDRKMKHPCTWLNGENWNDELTEPKNGKSKVDRAFDNILARYEAADAGDAEADAGDLEGTRRRGGEHSVSSGSVIDLSARRLA